MPCWSEQLIANYIRFSIGLIHIWSRQDFGVTYCDMKCRSVAETDIEWSGPTMPVPAFWIDSVSLTYGRMRQDSILREVVVWERFF